MTTLSNIDFELLAFSGYPSVADIVGSVALTFFAFLGFGVVTFTAKDLGDPRRQLPRAIYLALGIATTIYVAVALGVFGTLTVDEVIESGGTALAVAAEPVLGRAGYWLMTVTALFATSGATNAGLYPAAGLCRGDGRARASSRRRSVDGSVGERRPGSCSPRRSPSCLAVGFDLSSIASIGSAIALCVFTLITAAHLRVRDETGARTSMLVLAISSTVTVLVAFTFTTLVDEPATAVTLAAILVLSIAIDLVWKRMRGDRDAGRSAAEKRAGAATRRGGDESTGTHSLGSPTEHDTSTP